MLNWTSAFDGNRPVLSFIIYIRNNDNGTLVANITAVTIGDSLSYNISGVEVQPFTQYAFRVVSCNEIGCSDKSPESAAVQTDQYSEF